MSNATDAVAGATEKITGFASHATALKPVIKYFIIGLVLFMILYWIARSFK